MTEPPLDKLKTSAAADEAADASEAARAALKQVAPERLLEGEQVETSDVSDALHWLKVYAELLDFKRSVLTMTEQRVSSMDPAASHEVTQTDLKALHAEAQRFARRLDFWRGRSMTLQERADDGNRAG